MKMSSLDNSFNGASYAVENSLIKEILIVTIHN